MLKTFFILLALQLVMAPANAMQGRLDNLHFVHGLPSAETRQVLYDELDFQRAVQAVIWAEPLINNALFRQAMELAGVPNLGAMIYDELQQPGHETLTPNQSVIYEYSRINLKDTGPVVYELPAGPINAGFFDMWMRPVFDMGIVGPNNGKGDKVLLLPPGYQGAIAQGFDVARLKTWQAFTITRVFVNENMTKRQGTQLLQKIKTYPLAAIDNPPAKAFVLMGDPAKGGKTFRMNRPQGLAYWKLLHTALDAEVVNERDRITMGSLAPLGLEKGKAFKPDKRMQGILVKAEKVARAIMINEAFSPRNAPDDLVIPLYPGSHWENLQLLPSITQEGPYRTFLTARMVAFYQANSAQFIYDPRDWPPGMGQKYAASYQDQAGAWFDGGKYYRLRVPANVPVKWFWSLAVYDSDTRALIETEQRRAEFNPKVNQLVENADGSIDLYFGPRPPTHGTSNWIQTLPEKSWFTYFRWYGPLQAYYDKSWRLPDIENIVAP